MLDNKRVLEELGLASMSSLFKDKKPRKQYTKFVPPPTDRQTRPRPPTANKQLNSPVQSPIMKARQRKVPTTSSSSSSSASNDLIEKESQPETEDEDDISDDIKHKILNALGLTSGDIEKLKKTNPNSRSGYVQVYFEANKKKGNWSAVFAVFDKARTDRNGGQTRSKRGFSRNARIGNYSLPWYGAVAVALSRQRSEKDLSTIESDVKAAISSFSFDENLVDILLDPTSSIANIFEDALVTKSIRV